MRFLAGFFNLCVYGTFAATIVVLSVFWWHGRDLASTAELAEYQPKTLSRVYAADGSVMAEFASERRLFTPIDEVPDMVKHAFISAEDRNFYVHSGVDGVGLLKASIDNVSRALSGRRMRGASTITMQVVKNFLLDGSRDLSRKIKELLLAKRLETALSKDQILELYLNEIFLGSNAYGVTSAADRYFDKSLEELSVQEAAYLAALPKAPSRLHPVKNRDYAIDRRNYVLREMFENGYITEDAFNVARDAPFETTFENTGATAALPQGQSTSIDYFAEEIRRTLIAEKGAEQVLGGGLAIRATMDPKLQKEARVALQQRLFELSKERGYGGPAARLEDLDPEADPLSELGWRQRLAKLDLPRDIEGWRPAVVLLVGKRSVAIGIEGVESEEPIYLLFSDVKDWARKREGFDERGDPILGPELKTPGDVWALGDVLYVQDRQDEKGETRWSMRQIPDLNGALVALDPRTGRVLAMQGGFSHDASEFNRATQAMRQPGSAFKPFVYAAALEHGYKPNSIVLDSPITLEQPDETLWKPRNYSGRFYGAVPLRWGIEKSHNLMTVRVALDVGLETIAGYAETFGVYEDMPPLVSYALGAGETTLLKLATSYAMFVNGGKRIEPSLIDRIQDRWGKTLFRHDQRICLECRTPEWSGQPEPYVPDEGEQVINPVTAFQITSMMEGVTARGTASSVGKAFDFPVAGKTGTTNEARDAWFIGATNELVVGCFVGLDTPAPIGSGMSGGKVCAPMFESFLKAATREKQPGPFRQPSQAVLVRLNHASGCVVPEGSRGREFIWETFSPTTAPYVGQCPEGGIGGMTTAARQAQDAGTLPDAGALDAGTLAGPPPVAPASSTGGLAPGVQQDLEEIVGGGASQRPSRPGVQDNRRPRPDAFIGGGTSGLY